MQFLRLLIDESKLLTHHSQSKFIIDTLKLFEKQSANSLLLFKYDETNIEQSPLLCDIIQSIGQLVRNQ